MSRKVESTVYQFDELDERAKERARDWYRQTATEDFSSFGAESVIDDASRMALLFGLDMNQRTVPLMGGGTRKEPEVYYSGFSYQGDGASFVGRYEYRKGSVQAVAAEAPSEWIDAQTKEKSVSKSNTELNRIVLELAEVQRKNFYTLVAHVGKGRSNYSHEMTMDIDVDRTDEKEVSSEDMETVVDLMRDFARWIYRALEAEYEYQMSDECVDEYIRANDYEFTADGDRA